ncbi:hypothetical protein EVAR_73095_1 [Eumeta japonica]|uniref:Uncharacterized protein n=1 Tax=Eumeta variegata TaxID=151549 RepID=A0A4C1SJL0_EUMVA|nr:hypothetical protein EVAR_73095_1 [Eumeta japonica]
MYLFGGKFCKYVEDSGNERDCTCPEIISQHPRCECDRKHFNNILWATVTVFQRNERREREQRELAKSKLSSECFSDNNELQYDESNSGSHSSDSFSQNEIKNYWRSADDVRKTKDDVNGHKEKVMRSRRKVRTTTHHPTLCRDCAQSNKCNLQKESKMLANNVNASESTTVPMITHTAATPQDSPSTTLEPGALFRDFNLALSLERTSMLSSLDSIDRTSCTSIPGLLKPPNSYTLTLHSAAVQLSTEKARLPPVTLAPPTLNLTAPPLRTPSWTRHADQPPICVFAINTRKKYTGVHCER